MEYRHVLYGDGVHDDTAAIQERIDLGGELYLEAPSAHYLISRPLELPSGFRLRLARFAKIRLAAGSNCVMLRNKTKSAHAENTDQLLFEILNCFDPDEPCRDIEVEGGIWDFNNMEQNPNPLVTNAFEPDCYGGLGFLFYNVKGLRISSLTLKDPVTFAVTLDRVSYFTVQDITFDFNYGNPLATNMDGIHIDGGCSFGEISNLKGACYDDLVALNADEGSRGPITDISIRGLHAEDCHSAVRLLSANYPVKNIHISDVYGTYFQYCIGVTRFYESRSRGLFDAISIDHVYASKAVRLPVYNKKPTDYIYPLIFVEAGLHVKDLRVSELHRREQHVPVETVYIGKNTTVDRLVLDHITAENHTGSAGMPMFVCEGEVGELRADMIYNDDEKVEL